MDRGEPTLAPQWLKTPNSSSHSDETNSGALARNRINRLSVSVSEHDAPRASSSSSSSSSSSFWRIANNNGSMGHDRDSYANSRAYSSFSRSRDRDRDRDKNRHRDRQKDNLLDNGYCDCDDSLMTGRRSETRRTEIDTLRRSKSMVSGRMFELMPRRPGSDSINALSTGSLSGPLSKVSFERDFPSLGAEEKHEVVRVLSPGISSAINSLHISSPTVIGADRWTSALAEPPAVGVSNGLQTATSMTSTISNTTGGLSMAETLAQAPSKARSAPLLSNENERRKETLMQQYNKLIPVINSDKSKTKGVRNGDLVASKIAQPSLQLVNLAPLRLPAIKPDSLKTSQAGNFFVLNREKNGISPTAKDGSSLTIANKFQSAAGPHLKTPANSKLKANGVGEKKPPFQAQDRNNFFNSLRKQAEMKNGVLNHQHQQHPELNCDVSSSSSSLSSKSDEKIMEVSAASGLESSVTDNGNDDVVDEETESFVAPDEEEKAFLESLGWSENAGEDALTAEEIESFIKKHEEKLGPDFKYKAVLPESRRSGSSSSGSYSTSEEKQGPDFEDKAGLPESQQNESSSNSEEKQEPDFEDMAGLPESQQNESSSNSEEKQGPDFEDKAGLPESRRSGSSSSGSSSSSEAEM